MTITAPTSRAAPTYRLTCRCGAAVTVTPGQAGGVARCPACGEAVEVPRLRDLAPFEVAAAGSSPGGWRPCQAWLFLGLLVAAGAATAAVALPRLGIGGPALLPDESMIRAVVESADVPTILQVWSGLEQSTIDRGAMPEELRVQRAAGLAGLVSNLAWVVSGVGCLIALGGGLACLAPAGPRPAAGRGR